MMVVHLHRPTNLLSRGQTSSREVNVELLRVKLQCGTVNLSQAVGLLA
jgi:hypothetical protein